MKENSPLEMTLWSDQEREILRNLDRKVYLVIAVETDVYNCIDVHPLGIFPTLQRAKEVAASEENPFIFSINTKDLNIY